MTGVADAAEPFAEPFAEPIAETGLGALRGRREAGCAVFRGVPYARPPVGAGRFAAPEPAAPWPGLREAASDGPVAPQSPSRLERVMGAFHAPQDEDCLTLTIWTPSPDAARRPVLVWYHGGAYVTGAGSLPWYDGGALVRAGDVVVVGVNYRLGALGYLFQEGAIADTPALLDQAEALRWVVRHIAAFGGDPGAITIGGQSAGASSCAALIEDESLRPLIRRVILQSGAFGRPPRTPRAASEIAASFMTRLGIDPAGADRLARLRAVPVPEILRAQREVMAANPRLDLPFRPVARHGETTAEDAVAACARASRGLDVLVGFTSGEGYAYTGGLSIPLAEAEAAIAAESGDDTAVPRYRARFPGIDGAGLLAEYRTDTAFAQATLALAGAIARSGGRCFTYLFDWSPAASPFRACHCCELPFTFGNPDLWPEAPMLAAGSPAEIAALARVMQGAWIGFIREGTPGLGPHAPAWPAYDEDGPTILSFGRRLSLTSGRALLA